MADDRIIFIESAEVKKKRVRKYKCPFCDNRYPRPNLVSHVDRKHEDMIPEGYTALRVVYDYINHKDGHGDCRICKQPTPWNETKGRYEILCGRQQCKDKFREQSQKHYEDTYGSKDPANDPNSKYKEEIQKRAVANRRISGTYTFSDGGKIGYTGSYEKKFLEFMDKILHVVSTDIIPGPAIEYMYNGKVHMYLPDFYYIPYNLIIEIKDGGEDKKRDEQVREKTIAKEEAVREQKKYNYLRLVNNDFAKLMEVFATLKYMMGDQSEDDLLVITEATVAGAGALPNTNMKASNFYIVQNMKNNVFDYSITNDPTLSTMMHIDDDNYVETISKKALEKECRVFKLLDKDKADMVYQEAINCMVNRKRFPYLSFFEMYTGYKMIYDGQILKEASMEEVPTFDETILEMHQMVYEYLTKPMQKSNIELLEESAGKLMNEIDSMLREETIGSDIYDVRPFMDSIGDDIEGWEDTIRKIRSMEDNMTVVLVDTRDPITQIKDYDTSNLEYIEKKYTEWQSLSSDMRGRSNEVAMSILGLTNDNLYAYIKSIYSNKLSSEIKNQSHV